MEYLNHGGPIIGFGADTSFEQQTVQLLTGDRIVLYTDGLLEGHNPADDYFGKQHFLEVLRKHQHEPVQQMVDAAYASLKKFRQHAPPEDDISLLAVEFSSKSQIN